MHLLGILFEHVTHVVCLIIPRSYKDLYRCYLQLSIKFHHRLTTFRPVNSFVYDHCDDHYDLQSSIFR